MGRAFSAQNKKYAALGVSPAGVCNCQNKTFKRLDWKTLPFYRQQMN
jgi:hypothetical protein